MIISADILILGLIAGVILFRLYAILGKKDNDEDFKFTPRDTVLNNIVDISSVVEVQEANQLPKDTIVGFEEVINNIRQIEPNFSVEKFTSGAKKAFEMILNAFASNDTNTLLGLLDNEIYKQFKSEIDRRIANKLTLDLTLVALPVAKINHLKLENNMIFVDMRYESQQIALLKNEKGEIIQGDVSQIDNVEDYWTFSKELDGKNNWLLVKVNAG